MNKILSSVETSAVMIVDDMPSIRVLIETCLKNMGFTKFISCTNAMEASRRMKSNRVDLIICDYNMPRQTGLEFLKLVRSEERTSNIPFIMVTGEAAAELIHECIAAKVDGYIIKPFSSKMLATKVSALLHSS